MKRTLTIAAIALLTILLLYACSSTIRTATTSFVTITIGEDAHTARLKAEKATILARARYLLADLKLMPEAYAYIPSVVQVLVVTVSAVDMTTPIIGIASISTNQTTATLRIEVPNGTARQFTVEGIRGVDSQTYYRGTATTDLSGVDVDLPISMALVGPGLYVNFATGTDLPATTGTSTNPFQTITYALSRTSGTDAIYVAAGTYPPAGAAAGENYPLQLHPATAVLCTGANFSTILDLGSLSTTAIYGNDNASVDNCLFRVINFGGGGIAINDAIGGQPGQQSRLRINGASIEVGGNPTGLPNIGVVFNDDSLLLETAVTGSVAGGTLTGVQVREGKPSIVSSTISGLPIGIDILQGSPQLTNVTVTGIPGSSTGINITSPGAPQISGITLSGHGYGLYITGGNADIRSAIIENNSWTGVYIGENISGTNPRITNSVIRNNNYGVDLYFWTYPGDPQINSSQLYCNTTVDVSTNAMSGLVFNLTGNAWDHRPPYIELNSDGCMTQGVDVCYSGDIPDTSTTQGPVVNSCP